MLAATCCWRRLIYPWSGYPWKIWAAVDPAGVPVERQDAAIDFCTAPTCCLDSQCSQKLRGMLEGPDCLAAVADTDLQKFLRSLFSRAVSTSTYIERDFARLCSWSRQPQGIAYLASKHMCSTLADIVGRWRQLAQAPQRSHRRRPDWVRMRARRRRGSGVTGMHLFQAAMHPGAPLSVSQEAWRALLPGEQEVWRQRARGRRAVATVGGQPSEALMEVGEGPWGLWERNGASPVSRYVVEGALRGPAAFRKLAQEWRQDRPYSAS